MINISNNIIERSFRANQTYFGSNFNGKVKKGIYGSNPLEIEVLEDMDIIEGVATNDFVLRGRFKWSQEKIDESYENGDVFYIKNLKSLRVTIEKKSKEANVKPILDLLSKKLNEEIPTNTDGSNELSQLFNEKLIFSNPKPVNFVKYLIRAICYSDRNSIILDYHSGSGTTGQAVIELNKEDHGKRKFVLIEQMDYIEDIAKVRLQKVIGTNEEGGEQGGISKSVGWTGGGSFVYLELKKYNQELIEKIQNTTNKADLDKVYTEMKDNGFLQFWFDKKEFEKDENYKALPLEEQKKRLKEIIDLNHLYLNKPEMGDTKHKVSKEEITLTNKFYGKEN